jgi:anti-anti-sigma factor
MLVGELDIAGVPEVRSRLMALKGDLTIDCSALTFIDAAGIAVLLGLHRHHERRGSRLVLVDPSPSVVRLLALTKLRTVFNVRTKET